MPHLDPLNEKLRLQSVEERAEIRRRRRERELEARHARGEHIPAFQESWEQFARAAREFDEAMRTMRLALIKLNPDAASKQEI